MSQKFYEKRGLLCLNILLPKEGITYSISGKDFRCKIGKHKEVHLPDIPGYRCNVICQKCGKVLWQHEVVQENREKLINLTMGREAKTIIFFRSGAIALSALAPDTIKRRAEGKRRK